MVPRSYAHASPPPSPKMGYTEKDLPPLTTVERTKKKAGMTEDSVKAKQTAQVPGVLSPPPPAPSKPVVIPTRTRHDGRRKSKGQAPSGRQPALNAQVEHERALASPSMSALLAMTAIPIPDRLPYSTGQRKGLDMKNDAKRGARVQGPRRALSSSSPQTWDFLLSPPNDDEAESRSFSSDTTIGPPSSVRSISTESMPSLEEDQESVCSASDPATPAMLSTSRGERKKSLSTSKGMDCVLDHPLLPAPVRNVNDASEPPEIQIGSRGSRPPPPRTTTSFKSNLTASFRAVRSAARNFSDWTSPSSNLNRDDHLSQSLLSLTLPYTVERRPKPLDRPADPALRRYLNPTTLFPAELHFHEVAKEIDVKACVQMETYQRGNRPSQHASSPPIFTSTKQQLRKDTLDTEDPLTSSLSPRQREPRENSDFLRVIVLEMNMRKVGKLSGTNPGRAKLWLPARQGGNKPAAMDGDRHAEALTFRGITTQAGVRRVTSRKVPDRWAGVTV